ncbi:MAG TPA: iron transport regulator, partial [Odoribacter splanchnicus]|nr:iron transport regulator [Odoribacter splanchnicus]
QSLEAILYRLSHVYGVQFTVKSEALNRRTFTGTFYRGQNIKDILDIINISIPIRYSINNRQVIIN